MMQLDWLTGDEVVVVVVIRKYTSMTGGQCNGQ